jgi:hypothetical protein
VTDTKRHTPGPWRIWTSNSFRRISSDATGHDGDVLHAVVQRDGHPDLHFPNGGFEGPDARLIAAAPDLLEACKKSLGVLAGDDMTKQALIDALTLCRAAIAKATGATS